MLEALEDCNRGMPVATAAKKHGVPRVTLLYKLKGKTPINRRMGRSSYICDETEQLLTNWIKNMAQLGFPILKTQLKDSVKKIVDTLNIETPFTNGRPGNKWFQIFFKRHPDLAIRTAQNLISSRASVSKTQLKKWFDEVNEYLHRNGYDSVLKEPIRVFNMDESAFFLNPSGNKVLALKGEKTVYQQVNADEKECFTVLLGGNAKGDILPPMVIFKYERIPRDLSLSVPAHWGIGRSDSGWMTGESFFEYITNIFNPWLEANKITKPIILFMDGHTSHLTYHLSKFCSDNDIILVALYPNATHLLQPMDVAVFRTLKETWKERVHQWRLENLESPTLRKINFCPLLDKVIKEKLTPSILQNGFRKCGLVPWNSNELCCDNEENSNYYNDTRILTLKRVIKELEAGIIFLEKYVDNGKIKEFKNADEWPGPTEDMALFKLYKKTECLLTQKRDELISKTADEQNLHDVDTTAINVLEMSDDLNFHEPNLIVSRDNSLQNIFTKGLERTPNKQLDTSTTNTQRQNKNIEGLPNPSSKESVPSTSCMVIPNPFKKALFWPTPKENINRKRKREKIPAVITSLQWQKYHEDKERKKCKMEEEKKRKAEERKKKKILNEEIKKQKLINKKNQSKSITNNKKTDYSSNTSTDEEWVCSGDSIDDIEMDKSSNEEDQGKENCNESVSDGNNSETLKQGDYLLVNFPGKKRLHKYVCIVQNLCNKKVYFEVMGMTCCDSTKSIFKEKETDISIINKAQIVSALPQPNIIITGDRIKYKFSESIEVDG